MFVIYLNDLLKEKVKFLYTASTPTNPKCKCVGATLKSLLNISTIN